MLHIGPYNFFEAHPSPELRRSIEIRGEGDRIRVIQDKVTFIEIEKPLSTPSLEYLQSIKAALIKIVYSDNYNGYIYIDGSNVDRVTIGMIVGIFARNMYFKYIEMEYSESNYLYNGKNLRSLMEDKEFRAKLSEIHSEMVTVPYAEGKFKTTPRRSVFHCAGIDIERTNYFVADLEPTYLYTYGEREDLARLANRETEELLQGDRWDGELLLNNLDNWFQSIREISQEKLSKNIQPYVIVTGWKSQIFVAALWSIINETPLLTLVPSEVIDFERHPTGKVFRYRIENPLFGLA